jgi:hypothetical protein
MSLCGADCPLDARARRVRSALFRPKAESGEARLHEQKDVMAFVGKSFDDVIAKVSKLTPAQLSKTYASEDRC